MLPRIIHYNIQGNGLQGFQTPIDPDGYYELVLSGHMWVHFNSQGLVSNACCRVHQ
ncbi:hypothetical protein BDR07DRAFT_1410151 [Suillus spraguei]|nr:hypothetical protein BDR07DRAFT_1444701 [Suillus spraguei]KAG2361239.1 hypothetical protein BDR07DRAFT_1410151 [Suillus spraguei]